MSARFQLIFALFAILVAFQENTNAQSKADEGAQTLSARQRSIVAISAFTAQGELAGLEKALGSGLNAGLTVNEIKESLVQLYAYCGFPRSLNAINTFIKVLEKREKIGVRDEVGRSATPIRAAGSRYERGKRVLETLTGRREPEQKTGAAAFSPELDAFLKEHLFADIFERDVLSYAEREIVTIAALASLGNVEPQLESHLNVGLNVGLTQRQLEELMTAIENSVGKKEAAAGRRILKRVVTNRNNETR